jgi:hypothetical protein
MDAPSYCLEKPMRWGFLYFFIILPIESSLKMGGVKLTSNHLTGMNKKELLIQELLSLGIFKKGELHLFELSIRELEEEYAKLMG